ncbi:hypothetical protein Hanom_Chr07g00659551 [Helianthus anomalus]
MLRLSARKVEVAVQPLVLLTKKKGGAAVSRSSGSAGSRNPDAGATPSSLAHDEEEEEDEEEEPAAKLVSRKRSRTETTSGVLVAPKVGGVPLIGKQSNLRSLYRFSPEREDQGKTDEKPIGSDPKDTRTAATTASDKAQGPEVVRTTGLDQPHHEKIKEPEVGKPTETVPADAPV